MLGEDGKCWGGSQGGHPCPNEPTEPSGLCETCEAFAVLLAEALAARCA